ncbi:MAG: NAD(P)/FAD-dependent oxidoreductase [Bacteroidetes bacterium]|nr:MAG: NAD(P)/FAD-dependent oxidoreductase [Bacteroidota bacterium]
MKNNAKTHILIIGAGPAGLAMAGRLRKAGIKFDIIEKSDNVGNRWRHHYDRLHLHSVKRLSNLPHLLFPDSYPVYVPREKFVEYLESYAEEFNIEPEFGVSVNHISKSDDGSWIVETSTGTRSAGRVIIATGVNNKPKFPGWEGREEYTGTITHSVDYKNPKAFLNSRTLVVGMGNTGAEVALDLSEHGVETFLSARGALNIVPRDLNGKPVQETALILDKFPLGFGEWLGAKIQGIYFGNLKKYGIEKSKMRPAVQLKTTGKTPVIDIGTVRAIKEGKIKIVGEVDKFDNLGVVIKGGENLDVDHIIFATGYDSCLDDLIENMSEFKDDLGYPKGAVGTEFHKGLYFVGFNNYELGGILGTIYSDSETVMNALTSEYLLSSRHEI